MKDYNLDSFKFLTVGKAPEKETIKKSWIKILPQESTQLLEKHQKRQKWRKLKVNVLPQKIKKDGN